MKKMTRTCIIYHVLETGNIDYFIQIINHPKLVQSLKNKKLISEYKAIDIIFNTCKSNNIDLLIIVINFLSYYLVVTNKIYSHSLRQLFHHVGKERYKYSNVIYALINLGGSISGYSEYTDYIKSIKIAK